MCEVTPTIDYTPDDYGYTLLPPGVTFYTPDIYARWLLLGDKAVFGVRYSDRTGYLEKKESCEDEELSRYKYV